jgi:hypothetical protein
MAASTRPLAGLSLDADNEWSYLKTHGDPAWSALPSYLDVLAPTVCDLLDELGLRITFFVVGQDAALDKNADALRELVRRGHEVGNHSFHHEPWLHRYGKDQLRRELSEAEAHIERVTGQRPRGFRGPGFSLSEDVIEVLGEMGYDYDASTLPTFIGPLARAYYFRAAKLTAEQRAERQMLFGRLKDGLRPNVPYRWRMTSGDHMLELPVTTLPGVRSPFHLSYLLYLARVSDALMRAYLEAAARACRLTNTPISFLLHPLDILGGDQAPSLRFFPGMDLDRHRKRDIFLTVLKALKSHFDLVPMSAFAKAQAARPDLAVRPAAEAF